MDDNSGEEKNAGSKLVGSYRSIEPFSDCAKLYRCNSCQGIFRINPGTNSFSTKMGMVVMPIGAQLFKIEEEIAEHNRGLDELFHIAEKCHCHGRSSSVKLDRNI